MFLLQILAAGLSGLYSALPTALDVTNDDWYCINTDMVASSPELQGFVKAVRYCCEVVHVSMFAEYAGPTFFIFFYRLLYREFSCMFLYPCLILHLQPRGRALSLLVVSKGSITCSGQTKYIESGTWYITAYGGVAEWLRHPVSNHARSTQVGFNPVLGT